MQIEGSEAKFEINVLGKFTKQTYIGTFKVKCILSPLEEIEADKIYRELLGNNYHLSDETIKQKAFALAQLQVRVLQQPFFWENDRLGGGHIPDSNVILEILDKAVEAQEMYIESKEQEMKERQAALTKAIKNRVIEKEPELENVTDPNAEALADLDLEEEMGDD